MTVPRKIVEQIRAGTYQPSKASVTARTAAALHTSDRAEIRAGLEERALRNAVSILDDKPRFNKDSVEARIRGGVVITYGHGRNSHSDYFPGATLSNGVITLRDGSIHALGKGNVTILKPATTAQLRSMASTSKADWEKLAKRSSKHNYMNRFFYH